MGNCWLRCISCRRTDVLQPNRRRYVYAHCTRCMYWGIVAPILILYRSCTSIRPQCDPRNTGGTRVDARFLIVRHSQFPFAIYEIFAISIFKWAGITHS